MTYDFSRRASVRKYADRPVSDELLHSLLARAEHTQTMGNMQLYSVVATRSNEGKRALAPAHFNQPMVTSAPVVLTFLADFSRTSTWCEQRDAIPGYDNFLSFLSAATDALLYCQTFCNLAEEAGLGLCFLGTTIYNPDPIIDALHLPRLVFPVATVTLGWPAEVPAVSDRLPLSAILHDERYVAATPESIDRDYTARETLPENREFVRLNATETLAQIFTDIRYRPADFRSMSPILLAALRRQGFLE